MSNVFELRSVRRFRRSASGRIGLVLTGVLFAIALLAPKNAGVSPDFIARLQPPSLMHWLGTDGLGRDLFTLIWQGIQTSLLISLISVGVGALIGLVLGVFAGFFRGWMDAIISWVADILLAFPSILLAIGVTTVVSNWLRIEQSIKIGEVVVTTTSVLRWNLLSVIVAVGIVQIPIYIRLARSVVLSLREQDFVQAARAIGATSSQILWRHILPGSLTPIVVQATLSLGTATLEAAGLGFLGLGAQPPTPELGTMLADAFRSGYALTSPWTTIFPGVAITIVVLAFNLLGDGLRDGFDPRSQ